MKIIWLSIFVIILKTAYTNSYVISVELNYLSKHGLVNIVNHLTDTHCFCKLQFESTAIILEASKTSTFQSETLIFLHIHRDRSSEA